MTSLLDWTHKVTDVPGNGIHLQKDAGKNECQNVANWLKIPAVNALQADYRISAISGGGYRLKGKLNAEVIQECVVSLRPVTSNVEDYFETEFWSDIRREADESVEIGALDTVELEPIENGRIPAGRIVIETLSAALDPYPRHPDADLEPAQSIDRDDDQKAKESPFSVLSRLKEKP